jgi:hypothetical protein
MKEILTSQELSNAVKEKREKVKQVIEEELPEEVKVKGTKIKTEIESGIEELKNHYYIIVMDLCSSSVILEKLQTAGKIKVWRRLWKKIFNHMTRDFYFSIRCKPYKFVGDGFIILYRHQFSQDLFTFMQKLNSLSCQILKEVLDKFEIKPKRFGFAYGIDRGELIKMQLLGNAEFMGEAINAATRLQAQLKADEDACSLMVSEKVYNKIILPGNIKQIEKKCILRNLYDDKEILCHQIWL